MRQDSMGVAPLTPTQALREIRMTAMVRRNALRLLVSLVLTGAVTFILLGLVFGIAFVQGESMRPAFRERDCMLYCRVGEPKRGDAVILRMDGPHGDKYVKRIVALPGDAVDIDEQGRVWINGAALDEPYIYTKTQRKTGLDFPLALGESEYLVLGDDREHSCDSRDFGIVLRKQVNGKTLAVFRVGSGK